jgi:hypothetical protein
MLNDPSFPALPSRRLLCLACRRWLGAAPMCSLPLSMEGIFFAQASTGTNGFPHNNVSHWVFFLPMTHVFIFYLAMKPSRRLLTNREACYLPMNRTSKISRRSGIDSQARNLTYGIN